MDRLPLYEEYPRAAIEDALPRPLNRQCKLCALGSQPRIKTVCMPADGQAGGVLFVGEAPGLDEDGAGRPFYGASGAYLRRLVEKLWTGPAAFDNALRCYSGGDKTNHRQYADACRGYLAKVVREAKPRRIVALGALAIYSLLGRAPAVFSVRKGYGWVQAKPEPIPVYLTCNPAAALRNPTVRGWFEQDLAWALQAPEPVASFDAFTRVVSTLEDAREAAAELRAASWATLDIESAGIIHDPDYRLLSVSWCARHAVDTWSWDHEAIQRPDTRAVLIDLLTSVPLVGHGVKFDISGLARALDIPLRSFRVFGDTMLQRSMLESQAFDRLELASELVGMGGHKEEADLSLARGVEEAKKAITAATQPQMRLFNDLKPVDPLVARGVREGWDKRAYGFATVPRHTLLRYNARDTLSTARLQELLLPRLEGEPRLHRLWEGLTKPLITTFARIEQWGQKADLGAIEAFALWCDIRQRDLLGKLESYKLNPSSPQQLAVLLFDKLKLRPPRVTDSGHRSVDDAVLESLNDRHPIIPLIREWRSVVKMRGTYADGGERETAGEPFRLGNAGLLNWVRSDGRFHPSFKIAGTETGRPSCENPNLFNIPRPETEEGVMARNMFVAEDGWELVEFDQSQVELRVAAAESGDEEMIAIFHSGVDYHYRTAQLIAPVAWKMKPEDVPLDGAERSAAKIVNFSLAYQKGDYTLACDLFHVSKPSEEQVNSARNIKEAVLGKFRKFAAWSAKQVRDARRDGCIWVPWLDGAGLRRWLPDISCGDEGREGHAQRAAINSPIQGKAAFYTLASLIAVVNWIDEWQIPARVGLTVYDSILMEVHPDYVDEVCYTVPQLMTQWHTPNNVPLRADCKRGRAWGSLTKQKKAA